MPVSIFLRVDDTKLRDLQQNTRHRAGNAVHQVAVHILDDAKESIRTPYPPASERGNPPHLRTGRLYRSGRVSNRDASGRFTDPQNTAVSTILFSAPYSGLLESEDGLNRKFLEPAVNRAGSVIREYFVRNRVTR